MVAMKEIRALSRRIAREFKPQRIILFGSHAWGKPTEDSDVDLLVVLPFEGHPARKEAEILLRIDPDFAVDILARTPRGLRERLAIGDMFIEDIVKKGRVLYEAGNRRLDREGRWGLRLPRTRISRS